MTELHDLAPIIDNLWSRYGRVTPLEGLLLTRADAPSGILRAVYQPSVCVVVQGSKISMLGEQPLRYSAGQCLLASVALPARAQIVEASAARPYLAFSLAVEPEMVAQLLFEKKAAVRPLPGAAAENAALKVAAVTSDLYDPLRRLLLAVEKPGNLNEVAPAIRREIVWRLLAGPLSGAVRQIGLPDSQTARIGRAAAWIHNNFAQRLRVAELATMANMSVPSFHRNFKCLTAMTPLQFQKNIRLQEARLLLVASQEVASVGYKVGYESPAQFSREYRRMFGAPPGRDSASMRAEFTVQ